ncbi:hypothetical protein, partial [Pseudomonas viridiflava]|uniref:hypothetical protein n=1 Tax=Pseudomonas viridiflava TaxID=33069 RepID=UPI0019D010EA
MLLDEQSGQSLYLLGIGCLKYLQCQASLTGNNARPKFRAQLRKAALNCYGALTMRTAFFSS